MSELTLQGFHLSPQQEHLWGLQDKAARHYRTQCSVEIHGDLVVEVLLSAIEKAVSRHEILRTFFYRQPGSSAVFQVIEERVEVHLERLDWTQEDAASQDELLAALFAKLAVLPFDLTARPEHRMTLVALAPRRHDLLLVFPSLLMDGVSLASFIREIGLGYRSMFGGRAEMAEPVQYADVAQWQNELLDSPEMLEGRRFWHQLALDQGSDVDLPFEAPEGADAEFTPRAVPIRIPDSLRERLEGLALVQGVELPALLLSVWQLLLHRLSRSSEVIVGVAFAGRIYADLEHALGLFTRYLPLPSSAEPTLPFSELLSRTRSAARGLEEWQEYFDWSLRVHGGAASFLPFCFSHEPLVDNLVCGGVTFSPGRWNVCTDRFRLKLSTAASPSGLRAELHYDSSSVALRDAERVAGWFESLLEGAVCGPGEPIGDLEILSARERRRSLEDAKGSVVDLGAVITLVELFEKQAAATLDRTALVFRDHCLTFSEIDNRAERLANHLRALGVGPEVVVGLAIERSPEMVIGMLGILKAGGAYVPLDPDYPSDRLTFMLDDARVSVVLCQEELLTALPVQGRTLVCLDRDSREISAATSMVAPVAAGPDNLAYVIYTSGSTGKPKGVMIEHRAIANRLLWMQQVFPLLPDDSVLQKTPYSFDASIWEIFLPLLAGARMILAEPGGHRDSAYLASTIAEHEVTTLQFVPSFLAVFLQEDKVAELCQTLRRLFCGGEVLPGRLHTEFRRGFTAELINLYGPTENAIDATFEPCIEKPQGATIPIGQPLSNVQVYLLEGRTGLVPPGLAGELFIGGASLARGYWGRPALTADRFVPDPFGDLPGGRLYRTGDLARLVPGSRFEFLARADQQVKLRGFRIELGEIEAVLTSHPRVREAVVVLRQAEVDPQIVGYVVTHPAAETVAAPEDGGLSSGELIRFMAEKLPTHMIPAAFVFLGSLPRLPNGKLDRAILPAAEAARPRRGVIAPRTPIERRVAELWQELLSLGSLGVDDNFFELGGHSLLATQLVSRIRLAFGVEFRLRQLFQGPTIEQVAETLTGLLGEGEGIEEPALERIARSGDLPLSFAQQRLWFLHQVDPSSSAYNLPAAVQLLGELDLWALSESLRGLIRRHEILRTSFPIVDGRAVQIIAPPGDSLLPVFDLTALPAGERAGEAARLAERVAWHPFDLTVGPLLRCAVLRVATSEHLAVLSLHHIVSDGWSTGILIRELMALFEANLTGKTAVLPDLSIQYADYAVWLRRRLSGSNLEEQLSYWKDRLAGELPILHLPSDRPHSAVRTSRAGARFHRVRAALADAVRALGLADGCSYFMALLTAFKVLLSRYSGQQDLIIGTPVANRNRLETEPLIGMFVGSLVLRTRWSGAPTVRELLGLVREMAVGAFSHDEMPLEELVDALQLQRRVENQPLFQIMFMLQNFPNQQAFSLPGLKVKATALTGETAKFDLIAELREIDGDLLCGFEYKAELFDSTTIQRLAEHFENLLAAMVINPGSRISELAMLSTAESHQLTTEWNDMAAQYPDRLRIQDLVENQVRRTPQGVAVVFGGVEWTYEEVNRRANQIAAHLRTLGAGPGSLVAVYLERSAEMIPALLGVLKSGAAYVPLDVNYPLARIEQLLSSLAIEQMITQTTQLDRIDSLSGAPKLRHLVCLDEDPSGPADRSSRRVWGPADLASGGEENTSSPGSADDLAYIIFTSGSTGTPKGVMVTHRPVVNLIHWLTPRFSVGPDDRLLFITSLCFDLSVYDIFGILAAGGSIRVAAAAEVEDPERLMNLLYEEPITFWDSAPAALQQLVPFFPTPELRPRRSHLRRVFLSGDWIPLALPHQVRRAHPGSQVIALGGATEATVWSNFFPVSEIDPYWVSIPYGRPIANARYHVLDDALELSAIGVEGDLYIGGDCLFSGYVFDSSENAVKCIPDRFAARPGSRLYRTGDRARLRSDGNIEFLGRIDHQVKIRGFRIELGEIEATMLRHPEISEAIVIVREDVPGDRRLAAYFVAERGALLDLNKLRLFLKERLPDYMVPAAFVSLESVPVTANGKLDRAALPVPGGGRRDSGAPHIAPRNPAETLLSEIWAELLRLDSVGIHDNFFELGGDSILSIQIVTRARQAGLRLNPRDIFEYQTIAELASVVAISEAPQPERRAATVRAPVVPIQLWFLEADPPVPHHFNQAVLLEVDEPLEAHRLASAFTVLLDYHEALRIRFKQDEGEWYQAIEPLNGHPVFAHLNLGGLPKNRRSTALEDGSAALQTGLDLAAGPLLRAALFDLGPSEPQRLSIVVHHLVIDGISWRILLEDLFSAYRQLASGQPPALQAETTSYLEWAVSLVEIARGGGFAAEMDFWQSQLGDEASSLPLDHSGGVNTVGSDRQLTGALTVEETRALLQEIPQSHRVQLRDVLVTSLARTFSAWTGSRRVTIEIEGHGREPLRPEHDLSRTIGWFTSLYPLAFQVGREDPGADLKSVKQSLRSVPREGVGAGALRYLSGAERLPRSQGEVVFNYLGQLDQALPASSPIRAGRESVGAVADARQLRPHVLEVNASVAGGRLRLSWHYSEQLHRCGTIEHLLESQLHELRSLIAFCRLAEAPGFTPSDFPLSHETQKGIDRLLLRWPDLEDLYPLSALQEGLLFHSLEANIEGVYQQQLRCTLRGNLDTRTFENAWQKVIDRQPILRSCFVWEESPRPLQAVRRDVRVNLLQLDWRHLSRVEQQERLTAFLDENLRRRLTPDTAPLMRHALIQMADDEQVFMWVHHHLILDGWSVGRLIYELFEVYGAEREGREPTLPRPRPYRDYIAWLEAQDRQGAESFWRRQLAGFTVPTPLGRLAPGGDRAESYREGKFDLSSSVTASLKSWAQHHKLTLATLVEGAWAFLLGLYSGQRDVVFGAVSAGRPPELPGIEELVGLFITTLPIRAKLDFGASLISWLAELQKVQAESRQYEHCPLTEIQAWSDLAPGTALFDSLVVYENYPVAELVQGRGTADIEVGDTEFVTWNHYPLTLVAEPGSTLRMVASWDERRFEPVEIDRLLGHLRSLLEGFGERAPKRLGDLEILSAAERHQLLEWSQGEEMVPAGLSLPQLFEEQAQRWPDRIAVTAGDDTFSYRELEKQARQLAHYLRSLGIGPEVITGVLLDREVEMVVALLAILMAGGAYLPLETGYPRERLDFMIRDSGLDIVVTKQDLISRFENLPIRRIVDLDGDRLLIPTGSMAAPIAQTDGNTLVYLLYTSGSTGWPKGVSVTHRGLVNYLSGAIRAYGLGPETKAPVHSSLGFDLTVTSLFAPLLAGGSVDLLPESVGVDELGNALARGGYSLVKLTPAHLDLLRHTDGFRMLSVATLVIGGEALVGESLENWRVQHPCIRLINEYGPTETVVGCTSYEVAPGPVPPGPVPIGRAVANAQVYLLDERMLPVPAGSTAELYVGGLGVSRGYWKRPDLTAERFVPDPFSTWAGARLYRTGDLGRHSLNGTLEFLGRTDQQVKIRGFRIELGEVEAATRAIRGVRDAVVAAREDEAGGRRLVAYVVFEPGGALSADELRSQIAGRLPEYMVPTLFLPLDEFPLSANGKVDRSRLPAPRVENQTREKDFIAPSSDAERKLAEIWAEVLGLERVGSQANFFDLGGDSIIGLQIASRARRAGLKLAARQLFEHPTLAALAAVVGVVDSERRPPLEARERENSGTVPLTPAQLWFFEQNLAAPHHFNQSFFLASSEPLSATLLMGAAGAVAEHHDSLRLRFEKGDDTWSQRYGDCQPSFPLTHFDLRALPSGFHATALSEAAAQLQVSLDFERGPMARLGLFSLDAEEPSRLQVLAHHLIVDAFSWRILLEDLVTAYDQLNRGDTVSLPARTSSFRRWSERLREQGRSGLLGEERSFWRAVAGAESALLVPDGPGDGPGTVGESGFVVSALDASTTRCLLENAQRANQAGINAFLLAGLVEALESRLGSRRLVVDLESHGRQELWEGLDISHTVGWFTNLFPVLLDLEGVEGPDAPVQSIGAQLHSIPRHGLGWGFLRYLDEDAEAAQLFRSRSSSPVLFNYLGQLDHALPSGALLRVARESPGPPRDPRQQRSHSLEVNCAVVDGKLEVGWTFNPQAYRHATVEGWAIAFTAALSRLVEPWSHPDINILPDRTNSGLSREHLDRLLARLAGEASRPLAIRSVYRLSPGQEGMLFDSLSNPGAGIHIEQWSCQLTGELDDRHFVAAWEKVIEHHDVLRTCFLWRDLERPFQIVFDRVPLETESHDWRDLDREEQDERLVRHLSDDARRGFDLSRPPILRIALFRLTDHHSRLLWTHHHILLDGWCRARVLDQVLRCYEAAVSCRPLDLGPSPSYRDYIDWLYRQDLDKAERFWRQSLSGFTAPTSLGRETAFPLPPGPRSRHLELDLASEETEALKHLAQRQQLTLNTLVQAAWALLLSHYSGSSDVLFGITVSGRPEELPGIEETIGLFINTLPLRLKVNGEQTALSWLRELQEHNLDLRQYEFTAGIKVREWSEVSSADPLYNSIVVFENYPLPSATAGAPIPELTALPALDEVQVEGARTQFAATLLVHPTSPLNVRLVFDSHRLSPIDAPRILADLEAILAGLAKFPGARLGEILATVAASVPPAFAPRRVAGVGFSIRPPRTALEELIAGVWAEVLGLAEVGVDDDFLALGGHSLIATQIASRLSEVLGRDLPLRFVFETGTVAALANRIEEEMLHPDRGSRMTSLSAVERDGELTLSFAEQRLWFLDHWAPAQATFNIPVALRLHGLLSGSLVEQIFSEIVRRHEILRTAYPTTPGGQPVRLISPPRRLDLQVVELFEDTTEETVHRLARKEARRPFDVAKGPLIRVCLFRLRPSDHVLVFTLHHIISDAWSAGVLVNEVVALAEAFEAGLPSPLPEPILQYADFAAWQREWLQGEVLSTQLAYWRQQLGGAPALFELPGDRPRSAERSHGGKNLQVVLTDELSDEVRKFSRRHGVTLFMTLLTAFDALLYHRARREDFVVGTDIANRNRLETEGMLGFFVNQLALRMDLSGNPSFRDLLGRVRDVTLNAYAHQDLPFDRVVDGLGIERSLSYSPLFQLKLFVTNTPSRAVQPGTITLSPIEIDLEMSQLDLTIAFREDRSGPIAGWVNYSTDLFDQSTVVSLMAAFESLLTRVVGQPEARLSELNDFLSSRERELRNMEKSDWKARGLGKLKSVSPQKIVAATEVVKMGALHLGQSLPWVIEPAFPGVDLGEWAGLNQRLLADKLHDAGAILFRGFEIDSPARFERFASAICADLFNENGEHPRESVHGNVYTPVSYPKDQKLLMHNENSFNYQWPMKIMFCCARPADEGGETPIADSRKVYLRISAETSRAFEEKGVMYVRNYGEPGLGIPWQQIFQTQDRAEVEARCRQTGTHFEWKSNDRLKTWTVRPAVIRHPITGERVWFNQAQHWHIACLNPETRASMESLFAKEDLPRHCYFGDGSQIHDSMMAEVLKAYSDLEVSFPWQKGDVLLVDNVLTAHARNAFVGDRRILVALGEMKSFDEIGEAGARREEK